MTQTPTEPEVQDRKVEVVKLPLAEPLAPAELEHRLNELAATVRIHGCDTITKRLAQNIADGEYGGRVQNVMTAFPQLTMLTPNGKRAFPQKLDCNDDHKVDGQELTAITLAAGKWMADHPGKASADVPLDQEFLENYKTSVELVKGPAAQFCPAPRTPLFPEISKAPNASKGRE